MRMVLCVVVGYAAGHLITQAALMRVLNRQRRIAATALLVSQQCVESMENLLGVVPREGPLPLREATLLDAKTGLKRRFLEYESAY